MPEIPELEVYVRRTLEVARGATVVGHRLTSPFLLRTAAIPLDALHGRVLDEARRAGKHLAFRFLGRGTSVWLVVHLMRAGRLDWRAADRPLPKRDGALKLEFDRGALVVLEPGSKKQAALYAVDRPEDVDRVAQSAVDPLGEAFTFEHLAAVLSMSNTQLKTALTDWRRVGLGNAYSDEVLRAAGLSPLLTTARLAPEQVASLHAAIRSELSRWIGAVDAATPGEFPVDQARWRSEMAVHGRAGEPCGACGTRVERICYAEHETHYCPACQTGGRVLADRRTSRFLK